MWKDIALTVADDSFGDTVGNVEILYLFYGQRQKFVAFMRNQKVRFITFAFLQAANQHSERLFGIRRRMKRMQFLESLLQISDSDRLEQIGNTIDFERLECILIISRRKDDRTGNLHMLKNLERRPVCQMDVHENHIRSRVSPEPHDALRNAVEHGNNLRSGRDFVQKRLQVAYSSFFVFDDQCFHGMGRYSGSRTQNRPSSFDM